MTPQFPAHFLQNYRCYTYPVVQPTNFKQLGHLTATLKVPPDRYFTSLPSSATPETNQYIWNCHAQTL